MVACVGGVPGLEGDPEVVPEEDPGGRKVNAELPRGVPELPGAPEDIASTAWNGCCRAVCLVVVFSRAQQKRASRTELSSV